MSTTTNQLLEIKKYGQSIGMDNWSRDVIQSGELKHLRENQGSKGIASNPSIFGKAIANAKIVDELVGKDTVNTFPAVTI